MHDYFTKERVYYRAPVSTDSVFVIYRESKKWKIKGKNGS
jgi:hypothetical protein